MSRQSKNLIACLRDRADRLPEKTAFQFLASYGRSRTRITYGELHQQARSIAGQLQTLGSPGDRVLLLYPPGLEFIAAFFGCLYARQIAIPVPASSPVQMQRVSARLGAVLEDAQPKIVLGTGSAYKRLVELRGKLECPALDRAHLLTHEVVMGPASDWKPEVVSDTDYAFLQYTSGSTSSPRGVILSHANLMANVQMLSETLIGPMPDVRGVSWLPLYHDMGLIGGVLGILYREGTMTLMSPLEFLKRPAAWLRAISETRATISGAPDFAYQMTVERTTEDERAGLDLSTWEVAFSGAERIRPKTLSSFFEAFAPNGFRKEALLGSYGLAEATLLVSAGRIGAGDRLGHPAEGTADSQMVAPYVSCGRIAAGLDVAIVRLETGERCTAGGVGEIWVKGPNVAPGYWGHPEASEETFGARLAGEDGTFLRTGDLGFVRDGELYVTGRIKDLIIVGGTNHHPQDIEATVRDSHPVLCASSCAAFSVELGEDERLIVVVETPGAPVSREKMQEVRRDIEAEIRSHVSGRHMLAVHDIVFVRRGALPMTSSGKLQRHVCRQQYLSDEMTGCERS